jgi:hypothetical protein
MSDQLKRARESVEKAEMSSNLIACEYAKVRCLLSIAESLDKMANPEKCDQGKIGEIAKVNRGWPQAHDNETNKLNEGLAMQDTLNDND